LAPRGKRGRDDAPRPKRRNRRARRLAEADRTALNWQPSDELRSEGAMSVSVRLRAILSTAALTVALLPASVPPAVARDVSGAELTGNTLVWPGAQGEQNLIHFGRFGEFDWYFPCRFESGAWTLDANQVLHLGYVNPQLQPRQYRLSLDENGVTLTAPDGQAIVAELKEGDRLPYF
jgi:hypothetical protein